MPTPDFKVTFPEIQAAQRVVQNGIEQMQALAVKIVGQAEASQVAAHARAGQIMGESYTNLGGGGRALAETLSQLNADLTTLQNQAVEGSEVAAAEAQKGASAASTIPSAM